MIKGARRLSQQHLTIRVPWHDAGWNGRVCTSPSANTACLALSRIAMQHKPSDALATMPFDDLEPADRPPCVEERVGFMSDRDLILTKTHPYKQSSPDTHGHFGPTQLRLEANSAACIPFNWMLRKSVEGDARSGDKGKAEALRLGFDPGREPDLSFETSWIQDRDNQLVMLDTFFGAVVPQQSLCFFYAKRTPMSENSRRVIVAVGRVTGTGDHVDYAYERAGDLKGVLWERCVRHSIRPDQTDGVLMPYAELMKTTGAATGDVPEACIAFAPEDLFNDFSYASEHLSHDGAISSLLACAAALKAAAEHADVKVTTSLAWIDREIARLWKARGVHPGLGAALTTFGLEHGVLLAHEITRVGSKDDAVFDAFAFIDGFVANPKAFPQGAEFGFGGSFAEKWRKLPAERRRLLDLIARCDIAIDQAQRAYQPTFRAAMRPTPSDTEILANPYLLFERDEASDDRIRFATVDRGVFPPPSVRATLPLQAPTAMTDAIDPRRVRAFATDLLETAAATGHTLLPHTWIVREALTAPLDPKCLIDEDVLSINAAFLAQSLSTARTAKDEPALKLRRYADTKAFLAGPILNRVAGRRHKLDHPWRDLVDDALEGTGEAGEVDASELKAREEKAAALEQLANGRFSVLVGPAGSGKTTLLRILCELPEVDGRGVLLLAPTGKARVRLEEATERRGQAKTIAQFLQRLKRYDGTSGRYFRNAEAPCEKAYKTVVVDECSMLTEDQLAALFDALEQVERLVLVGDPRQLPPIGAGRPFVDICRKLAPDELHPVFPRIDAGYAELTIVGRQRGPHRGDVLLARQFSGEPLDAGADEVWDDLRQGKLPNVRTVHWSAPEKVQEITAQTLVEGLKLESLEDQSGFERSVGGTDYEGRVFFWPAKPPASKGAAASCHDWQVLSPIRAGLAGVDALNASIQARFRAKVRERAESSSWSAKIPQPAGPQALLWGDKVINVRNNGRRRTYPKQDDAYVANGDIGVVVGEYKTAGKTKRPKNLEVEFNSQSGIKYTYPRWEFNGDEGSPDLELAYVLTVHKTQGSQFGRTFVVVPRNCRLLSRELLYTALTRHQHELTILHEDDIGALRHHADPSASEIARRMTDLFSDPEPIEITTMSGIRFLDKGLLHRTSRNELVRSKAELAIAEKLIAMGVNYVYERPLTLGGKQRWPDFTIENDDTGVTYYWEHLGMLADPDYERRWQTKKASYLAAGVKPFEERGDADQVLITTMESATQGLDMPKIEALASAAWG